MDMFISATSFHCYLFFSDHLRGFKSFIDKHDRLVFQFHAKLLPDVCPFVIGIVCQKEYDSTHTCFFLETAVESGLCGFREENALYFLWHHQWPPFAAGGSIGAGQTCGHKLCPHVCPSQR